LEARATAVERVVNDGVRHFQMVVLEMEKQQSGSGVCDARLGLWWLALLLLLFGVNVGGCFLEERVEFFRCMSS
jgi:hypothetical protein